MADILPFKKRKLSDKHKGRTLCKNGFHKWKADGTTRFDTKAGKLVTVYRCERCDATKVKAT